MDTEHNALKDHILRSLQEMGFTIDEEGRLHAPIEENKDFLRQLHLPARQMELQTHQIWLQRVWPRVAAFFAEGTEVIPEKIKPVLIEVESTWQQNLFRVARLLWSLPFSKGYGRRLRFLVMDKSNGKLIGILALQSPPLSFPARDRRFRYPPGRKTELVNQTMDIQTLGAVPPYSRLLGGKLIALAAASNEVREAYRRKYAYRTTEIEKRLLPSHLVALTTTSAFGRSSLYNRLKYRDMWIAEPLGYTEGYGSFHLMMFYPLFRSLLESQGISTRGGFGTGPRRKWQTMVRALARLNLPGDLLRHGIKREAFLFPLIDNLQDYMEGRTFTPLYRDLPFETLVRWWRERWLLPRAERVNGWHTWSREELKPLLLLDPATGEIQ
ncbi:DUF4338 domain-containing protein [Thermanaerothrix sp. 4228-RoL]|uniref:DUF4338 domain-containing protein n=1 Tax=Thermanaerothrix solaris TaxID=3058434 RepID=A0ABU3NRR1_9CHLR|nr:Druantia anti-phage system protein DruA [Thermanaerothrix sp. 4228-RoL]MDT8898536.1 DUF4338 domain-containing protein [Thermanaerothrix sp. 4228-RoL]